MTWHRKETIRSIYDIDDCDLATHFVDQLVDDLRDHSMPTEVRSPDRTIARWRDQIVAWHRARASNGPTEAVDNLVERVAFVIINFCNYRIRALLYAGKPTWNLLATLTPRQNAECRVTSAACHTVAPASKDRERHRCFEDGAGPTTRRVR